MFLKFHPNPIDLRFHSHCHYWILPLFFNVAHFSGICFMPWFFDFLCKLMRRELPIALFFGRICELAYTLFLVHHGSCFCNFNHFLEHLFCHYPAMLRFINLFYSILLTLYREPSFNNGFFDFWIAPECNREPIHEF